MMCCSGCRNRQCVDLIANNNHHSSSNNNSSRNRWALDVTLSPCFSMAISNICCLCLAWVLRTARITALYGRSTKQQRSNIDITCKPRDENEKRGEYGVVADNLFAGMVDRQRVVMDIMHGSHRQGEKLLELALCDLLTMLKTGSLPTLYVTSSRRRKRTAADDDDNDDDENDGDGDGKDIDDDDYEHIITVNNTSSSSSSSSFSSRIANLQTSFRTAFNNAGISGGRLAQNKKSGDWEIVGLHGYEVLAAIEKLDISGLFDIISSDDAKQRGMATQKV